MTSLDKEFAKLSMKTEQDNYTVNETTARDRVHVLMDVMRQWHETGKDDAMIKSVIEEINILCDTYPRLDYEL